MSTAVGTNQSHRNVNDPICILSSKECSDSSSLAKFSRSMVWTSKSKLVESSKVQWLVSQEQDGMNQPVKISKTSLYIPHCAQELIILVVPSNPDFLRSLLPSFS